ncbi:MAG: hypothetical protein JWL77_4062 [Chthonomonadaceae bacterium]|nr:hypothetical protein [Chthonomonadaceae bacterium]
MHYLNVRVVDADGRPLPNVQVAIHITQFVGQGGRPAQFTDARGEAEFPLDIGTVAEITVFLDSPERVSERVPERVPQRAPRWQRTRRV